MEKPSNNLAKNKRDISRFFPFIVFFVSLAFNLFYFNWKDAPILHPDSISYINFAKSLKALEIPDIFTRTPIYPLYLLLVGINLKLAAYGQIVIGALSNVLLYLIGVRLIKRKWITLLSVLLVSSDFFIANFNSLILTEALSAFLLLLSLYLHIRLVTDKISSKLVIFTFAADISLMFIRPNLIFLPIAYNAFTLLFLYFYKKEDQDYQNNRKLVSFGSIIYTIFILSWCLLNLLQNNHFNVSGLSDIGVLGKLSQYKMIRENEKATTEIPESANNIISIYQNLSPDTILERDAIDAQLGDRFGNRIKMYEAINLVMVKMKMNIFSPFMEKLYSYLIEEDRYNVDPFGICTELGGDNMKHFYEIRTANSYYLENNKTLFMYYNIRNIPKVMMAFGDFYAVPDNIQTKAFFYNIRYLYIFSSLVTPAILLIYLLALLFYLLKKNRGKIAVLGLILLTIFYVIPIVSALGYSTYFRLIMSTKGLIEMLSFILILMAIHTFFRAITNAFSKNN